MSLVLTIDPRDDVAVALVAIAEKDRREPCAISGLVVGLKPTLKLATNSGLAQRKPHWIDFDAGRAANGQSLDEAADALLGLVLATASGQPTRAEENGEREIALWKRGVTL